MDVNQELKLLKMQKSRGGGGVWSGGGRMSA